MSDKCKACGAPIFFGLTSAGKLIPIDVEPVADGNVILGPMVQHPVTREGLRQAIVLSRADTPLDDPERFVSHFVSCPNADSFRRGRR